MKLNTLTLTEAIQGLKEKKFSLAEIYEDINKRITETRNLNIYLTINDKALDLAKKQQTKPLMGLPIAVKDNFLTKGLRTTAASKVLDNFIPPYESTVTKKLAEAGGVVIGKTNLDAWAHGSSTETSDYGPTLNPRNSNYLPGGSSGGSAAAVAADAALAALGTETAGSIRQPAAWCGVVGLKPTYGRVSRRGVVAMASSTDSPGPMTKTVADAALLLNYIAGHDPYDATSSDQAVPDYTKALNKPIKDLRVGYIYHDVGIDTNITNIFEKQLKKLEEAGAKVEKAAAFDPHYAIGVYTIVQRAEVSSNLNRYDGVRYGNERSFFKDEAKRRIMLGTFALSKGYADKYYLLAQKARTIFKTDFQKLFKKYDVLVSLTSPGFAKKVGASKGQAAFGELEDMLLEPSSIVGLPGINLPVYRDPETNLYLGANIVANYWDEATMIKVAHAWERILKLRVNSKK